MFKHQDLRPGQIYDFHLKEWITEKNEIVPEVTLRRVFLEAFEIDGSMYIKTKRPVDKKTQSFPLEIVSQAEEYANQ